MDSEQLARFLAGEMTAAERQSVEAWAASSPEAAQELALLEQAWSAKAPPGRWDVDAAWGRLQHRLDRATPAVIPLRPSRRAWYWAAAAAAVLVVAAGVFLTRPSPGGVYATGAGERREVGLADGSAVILAPESRLEVPSGFGRSVRQVSLTGRAWFDVRHDPRRPFRVEARGAVIEDLGTRFEVMARPGPTPVQVTVVAGSVAVHPRAGSRDHPVTLVAGDLVRIPEAGPLDLVHEAPVERLTGWRDGTLSFDNSPLEIVAAELTRWYGVEITAGDSIVGSLRLDGPVPTANLDEALSILRTALPIDVRRSPSRIVLVAKASP